jgi:hypothetical protein
MQYNCSVEENIVTFPSEMEASLFALKFSHRISHR